MKNQNLLINNVRHIVSAGVALGFAFLIAFFVIFAGMMAMSLIARAFGLIVV